MLVFEATTAEELRKELVDYLEGLANLEELKLCQRSGKKEQQDHESRRDLLISLSDKLKSAEIKEPS